MKEKRRKAQAKNKEPKEEIVVDLGERKNKTSDRKKPLSSLGSSFENVFNEERQLSSKENSKKIRQNEDLANNVHHEKLAAAKW